MSDYFEVLNQPCRPWLDERALKEAFTRLAAARHPDNAAVGDSGLFIELNSAYATLREPALRLRYLLELVNPGLVAGSRAVPPALAEMFMELAARRQRLVGLLEAKSKASSPLAMALLAEERRLVREQWESLQVRVEVAGAAVLTRLRELDARWPGNGTELHEPLAELLQELAYLARWRAQIHEALVSIDM